MAISKKASARMTSPGQAAARKQAVSRKAQQGKAESAAANDAPTVPPRTFNASRRFSCMSGLPGAAPPCMTDRRTCQEVISRTRSITEAASSEAERAFGHGSLSGGDPGAWEAQNAGRIRGRESVARSRRRPGGVERAPPTVDRPRRDRACAGSPPLALRRCASGRCAPGAAAHSPAWRISPRVSYSRILTHRDAGL